MIHRSSRSRHMGMLVASLLALGLLAPVGGSAVADDADRAEDPGTYRNPLEPRVPRDGVVESCADPTVIHGQEERDSNWYMYCTTDPLNDEDLDANGELIFHRVPTMVSKDLVNWTYVGDAFPQGMAGLPNWAEDDSALWAPEVTYSRRYDQYYMFVGVTDTTEAVSGEADCDSDNAIGVATSDSPTGPWTFSSEPVVDPRRGGPGCNFKWTYDPDVLRDNVRTKSILYYGSYYGGIYATPLTLTRDGATAVQGDPHKITVDNKYEGANVVKRNGYYYLFVSATNCCNGALTGYSVFAGRSTDPLGPFVDREGNSLLDVQTGGTPVISMNGNRWVGTGHNTVFRDAAGDWWTIYHAVDQGDPFFETVPGFTKRPALLDAIDWVRGWPMVNGGRWASDRRMPAPAGQPGEESQHEKRLVAPQLPGRLLFADRFSGRMLDDAWSVRRERRLEYSVRAGNLRMEIQEPVTVPNDDTPDDPNDTKVVASDLNSGNNTASVVLRRAPRGDFIVETALKVNIPDVPDCCYNYAQGGVLVYQDDDNFVKLTNTSIWNTRQTEWAKEIFPVPEGWNRYGNTVVGPPSNPGEWTYLRVAVERLNRAQQMQAGGDTHGYTAYTSQDRQRWVRGGEWTHTLTKRRIGLVAMGLAPNEFTPGDYVAKYNYVRAYRLKKG
uniref:GH43_3 / GH43 / GH43_5 / GH43_4 / GH43_ 30 / GH43_6 / GH43_33 / GH43_31 / GH43_8 / GH43 _34 / GH43_7 n=1 Tax=uncultured Nocardioidaceae bacterium TaxID=253824 RepID=A0A6J4M391_9ACTN|nr:MAG: GH43_3 / GH43 / GH43_5 / GH43_4 / GH43_ 30 / GH43_6 / GH43_33 / GH43_31 / GH43_8 / GH43 _34 / GH43_7 [uncultured Nocardioidaceae bacterium]